MRTPPRSCSGWRIATPSASTNIVTRTCLGPCSTSATVESSSGSVLSSSVGQPSLLRLVVRVADMALGPRLPLDGGRRTPLLDRRIPLVLGITDLRFGDGLDGRRQIASTATGAFSCSSVLFASTTQPRKQQSGPDGALATLGGAPRMSAMSVGWCPADYDRSGDGRGGDRSQGGD